VAAPGQLIDGLPKTLSVLFGNRPPVFVQPRQIPVEAKPTPPPVSQPVPQKPPAAAPPASPKETTAPAKSPSTTPAPATTPMKPATVAPGKPTSPLGLPLSVTGIVTLVFSGALFVGALCLLGGYVIGIAKETIVRPTGKQDTSLTPIQAFAAQAAGVLGVAVVVVALAAAVVGGGLLVAPTVGGL